MADVKNITENKIFEEIIKTKNMISLGEEIPLCKVATTSDLQEMESNITNILSSQFSLIHRRLEEVSNVHKTTYPENTIENLTEHPNNTLENDHLRLKLNESEKMNIFLQKEVDDLMNIINLKITNSPYSFNTPTKENPQNIDFSLQTGEVSSQLIKTPNDNRVENRSKSENKKVSITPVINNNLKTPVLENKRLLATHSCGILNKGSINDVSIDESIDEIFKELNIDNRNESIVKSSIYDDKIKILADKVDTQNQKIDYFIDLLINRDGNEVNNKSTTENVSTYHSILSQSKSYDDKIQCLEEQIVKQNQKIDQLIETVANNHKLKIQTTEKCNDENKENEDSEKPTKNIEKKLEDQITEIRNKHKEKYYREHLSKLPTTQTNQQKTTPDENATSPEKTKKVKKKSILVVGDSLLNGIEESKLSKSRHIRVQPISGGKIEDIRSNLNDLLHADLQHIILHIGTNNAVTETPTEIFNKLLSLKEEIVEKLPSCNIIISNPTKRTDDVTAHKTNEEVIRLIKSTDINFIDNGNIKEKHLGKRGLHLNARGNSMLAGNLLNAIRK